MGGDTVEKSWDMLEPFLFSRGGGKWRAECVRERGTFLFRAFSTLLEYCTISSFLPCFVYPLLNQ